jgi:hypothetical protein
MKTIKRSAEALLLTFAMLTMAGCSLTQSKSFDFTTLSCETSFVKHFKYDEIEVLKFQARQNKSIFLMGATEGAENCTTYPCQTCKYYICKDPKFTDIKFYNKSENKIYSMSGKKSNEHNSNFVNKWVNKDIVKNSNSDYVFNINHRDGYEYEQVFNIYNGHLVYEIATPIHVSNKLYVSSCDVQILDIYNGFYTNYIMQ